MSNKVVVVHRGARDGYHVARALAERGLLETLVTDLYWPADRAWAQRISSHLPPSVAGSLRARWSDAETTPRVQQCWGSGIASHAMSKLSAVPFDWQRRAVRWSDRTLGARAGQIANERDSALLSYSYYGDSAFSVYRGRKPRVLFQLHPHPKTVRDILRRERELHPECSDSLSKEWELALPDDEFKRLCREPLDAEQILVASSFTKHSLEQAGIPEGRIHVIPYGTDTERFRPLSKRTRSTRLRLLFVGTINQRKGIKYLLDAMRMLPKDKVQLLVCGRVVDDLKLFTGHTGVEVRPSVSADELTHAYQNSDVFVFPSLAEGFGHVLLEAMASGLPVISTARTAALDLVRPGKEGFLVEAGDAHDLAASIERFLADPKLAVTMGDAARARAEEYTWPRFRARVGAVMESILTKPDIKAVPALV